MARVNIPSSIIDPQYRYTMPQLILKHESSGNGSKTCIVNVGEVGRALHRPPQYITKWFGNELGALTTSAKGGDRDMQMAFVKGHLDTRVMQPMLDKFIHKYVLCENCNLPESNLVVKRGRITAKCRACGWAGPLDNDDKLAKYIITHPPDASDASGLSITTSADVGTGGGKKDRQARRAEKAQRQAQHAGQVGRDDDDLANPRPHHQHVGDEQIKVVEVSDTPHGASQNTKDNKCKSDKKDKKDKDCSGREGHKHEHRSTDKADTNADICASEVVEGKAKARDTLDGLQYDEAETRNVIKELQTLRAMQGNQRSLDDFFQEVRLQQISKVFDHKSRLYIVLETLCGNTMDAKTLGEVKHVVAGFIAKPKMEPSEVLWAFGAYLQMNRGAVKLYPLVLKLIYDEDWASEEQILNYYGEDRRTAAATTADGGYSRTTAIGYLQNSQQEDPGFAIAKQSASPFLKWLQSTASDDEESSDDDATDSR